MNIQHQRVVELCNELRLGGVAAQYTALAQKAAENALRSPTSSRNSHRAVAPAACAGRLPVMEYRVLCFAHLLSLNNHSGNLTSHPDPVVAERDSSRDFVVSVCRFVFRILAGVFDLPIDD